MDKEQALDWGNGGGDLVREVWVGDDWEGEGPSEASPRPTPIWRKHALGG